MTRPDTTGAGAPASVTDLRSRRRPAPAEQASAGTGGELTDEVLDELGVLMLDPDRIYHVPPTDLVLGPNVRTHYPDDPDFRESLRERGVLQPLICYLDGIGRITVLMGGRRLYFSLAEKLATVPVRVLQHGPDDIDRVLDQLHENDQRLGLLDTEHLAAVQQLAAFGLPAADIARRGLLRREHVDAALAVAASPAASEAAARHDLTLTQAATIAELGDDAEQVAELVAIATDPDPQRRAQFDHVAQVLRDERRDAATVAQVAARLRTRGIRVLDERPEVFTGGPARLLTDLHIAPAEHESCPGHAVHVFVRDLSVWDGPGPHVITDWVCLDAAGHGHLAGRQTDLDAAARAAERAEQRRTAAEWRAAQTVRRRWLRELAQRKTPPRGAERFVLTALLSCDPSLTAAMGRDSRHRVLRDLLGMDRAPHDDPGAATHALAEVAELLGRVEGATFRRCLLWTVVAVLAAWEEQLSVHRWAQAGEQDRRYLRQMIEWGYPASMLERRILADDPTGVDVDAGDGGPS